MNVRHNQNQNLTIHNSDNFNGLSVQTEHGNLIHNYLASIHQTILNAVKDHPRTCAIRVDLRLKEDGSPTGSNVISKFINSLKEQVQADLRKKERDGKRVYPCRLRYVWVKEKNTALHFHYHVVLLFNKDTYYRLGDFDSIAGNMASRIKKAWASALGCDISEIGGVIHFPENSTYYININSPKYDEEFADLFERLSYFAKEYTKDYSDSSNSFGCSRK